MRMRPTSELQNTSAANWALCRTPATMQVAPGSDGIQKLLAAEQEAQRIVTEARKGAGRTTAHLLSYGP